MSTNHSEISSFIWSVCDDLLRGLFKQHEYGDVILPFVVLRRLDCVLETSKDKVIDLYEKFSKKIDDPTPVLYNETGLNFYNYSRYDLQRLKQDHLNISLNFNNYLNGFSPNVREIIENFQLEKPIEKLNKNGKLYQLVETFTSIDLHPDRVDNHSMGSIFEELLRRFSEMSNETSGEHYTPRDEVRLLVSLVFSGNKEDLQGQGKVRSLFDCCCGTGGILSIGKRWILENINSDIEINLYGQELNPQTYSVCKSDMLITGENPDNIRLGSSLSNDHFQGRKFDYLMSNVPFGVSWKSEQEFIENESQNPNGRFFVGTPRTSDGSLLFLQHMISKMEPTGSRIGIIFNGSPLFTGDSGSGESEIRKWIIENDWLECIVQLPDQLFFNTGITTYIWILSNNKKPHRKGKIQLIDGSTFYKNMKKSLGNKRKFIPDEMIEEITNLYEKFEVTDNSKIYPNEFFGYTKVTIERPSIVDGKIEKDKKGNPKPDSSLRDTERIPLGTDIDEYFLKEVKPHLSDSWMDRTKDSVGYEINFTKYFYKYKPLRSVEEITKELLDLEKETDGLMNKLLNQ
ncbi:MAG TPA: class I SAM-dependent DNA methyltransferase [Caldisericia bacterium]|jgi:type I restriction enzyme M protein|nr:class I SAM-dependent DNA methyltransferase [Caldisericia bacterium]